MPGLFIIGILVLIVVLIVRAQQQKKKKIAAYKLPANAKVILEENVAFYRELGAVEKQMFEERLRDFLARTAIAGIKGVRVTDLDRLLVASAAIIPIFSFPDWKYNNIDEVLLYKEAFDKEYRQDGDDRNIIGMVGSGAMQGQMILSQPSLRTSFQNPEDGLNTAIHEFAHLLDKADGAVDGVPEYLLSKPYIIPWVKHMHETIQAMKEGDSRDINLYGASNDAEFFAVVTEYFFERPTQLQQHHPELYRLLEQMFHPVK